MPSANEPSPDLLIDADDAPVAHFNGQPEPEPEFHFAPSAPSVSGKKSKKKGKKNAKTKAPEADGSSPYGTSVTPSPPKNDGVRLAEHAVHEDPPVIENLEAFQGFDEPYEAEPVEEPIREPTPPPPPPARAKSPRPAPAKPIQVGRTSASRSEGLSSPPQEYSGPSSLRANKLIFTGGRPSPPASSPPVHLPPFSRRESATHTSPRPRFVEPVAPPHKAQPHFYGAPDFGLNLGQQKMDQGSGGKTAGSDGYCCCFDTLADSGDAITAKRAKDALLVGSEGGLEVYRVLPNKFEVVGRLEGLRGSVIGAKVLPQTRLKDSAAHLRPLVAVVVHGPMADAEKGEGADEEPPGYYQTSVEVYSLQDQRHMATLYRSTPVAVEKPTLGQMAAVPGPVGDLTVTAEGRFIVVASGKSGEVFIFSDVATIENTNEEFRCLGKFWATLQTSPASTVSRPQSSSEGGLNAEENDEKAGVPLFSLSQRWLALVAPSTSAHVSIGGSPTLLGESATPPPSVGTHVAPPPPPISCDIAGVDAEGTWSRLGRQAAQGLVKYSHKGIEIGMQGLRELTNPTPPAPAQHARGPSHEAFPPTMAPADDPNRVIKEPAIVSILDLDNLLEAEELKSKYPVAALSTFALEEGCNFLALSSSGLRLLSVSRSGKVSTVWDLIQSCHGIVKYDVSSATDDAAQSPCVKQIHRFERNSESVVVDAGWSRDDDMLAVLTSHGTVHLHEVPSRPFRKRKRRNTSAAVAAPTNPEKAQPTVGMSAGMSPPSSTGGGWVGTLRSGLQQVQSTVRAQSSMPSFPMGNWRDFTTTASQASGRVIARGFTAARGGAVELWHADDNKIKHPALRDAATRGALRWIRRPSAEAFLAVVCAGTVHLHPVQRVTRRRGEETVSGLKHERYGRKSFALPAIRGAREEGCAREGVHGFWSLRGRAVPDGGDGAGRKREDEGEVETNPPYCPFHVDARVGVYAFCEREGEDEAFPEQGRGGEEAWLFGAPLPESVRLNGVVGDVERDEGMVQSRLISRGEGNVQVVMSPRRGGGVGEKEEDEEVV